MNRNGRTSVDNLEGLMSNVTMNTSEFIERGPKRDIGPSQTRIIELEDKVTREHFNKVTHKGKQRINLEATHYFLKSCRKENVIPNTFKIPNTLTRIKGNDLTKLKQKAENK